MRWMFAVLVCVGCNDGSGSQAPDGGVDAKQLDAAPDAGACLSLAPSHLEGTTPLGAVNGDLDYFGSGDCITISGANLHWIGFRGEQAWLSFPYPVVAETSGKRHVAQGAFDTSASFEHDNPNTTDTTSVHVEVNQWQEGDGIHTVDITVSFTDARYGVAPTVVRGTFCDWSYLLCAAP